MPHSFEYFYGFVGAETNQWYLALYDGATPAPTQRGHRSRAVERWLCR
jgi:arylsulfatase A-like enzyme